MKRADTTSAVSALKYLLQGNNSIIVVIPIIFQIITEDLLIQVLYQLHFLRI